MKRIILLPFFIVLIFTNLTKAQPSNNDCSGAISLTVAADEISAIPVTGTTVGATGSTDPTTVCSGAWFGDDVWYEFTTGSVVPPNGVTIKVTPTFGSIFQPLGMGIYLGCGANEVPITCMSQTAVDTMTIPFLQVNTTYKIRMWSGGSPTTNSGAFNIIVYENYYDPNIPIDVVLWGNQPGQGDFNGGLNGWTSVIDSASATPILGATADWIWEADATSNGAFGNNTIVSPTAYNGAALFDADFMSTAGSQANAPSQPYPIYKAELLSPIIDCSGMSPLSVKFYQHYRALNGNCYFSYSVDGGNTFSTPINVNNDILGNESTPSPSIKKYFLPDANESSLVQLKFTADIDFYNWIIDDVQLVEREKNNVALVEDFIAIAPTYAMPEIAIDTIRFLANVTNTGSNDATNVVVTVNVVRDFDNATVFTTSHYYGNIPSGDTIENQIFNDVYFPDTTLNSYTVTYILSSDSTDAFVYDDTFSYQFEIVNDYFDKSNGINSNVAFNENSKSYTYGTSYYVYKFLEVSGTNNLDTLFRGVSAVVLGVANPDELAGETINIWIEKPLTGNQFITNGAGEIMASNRQKVGKGTYTFTGNEPNDAPFPIPVVNVINNQILILEDDMNYIITMEYNAPNTNTDLFMLVSSNKKLNYNAVDYISNQIGIQRFSRIVDRDNTGTYQTTNFSDNVVPFLRLYYYEMFISTKEIELNPNSLKISPNPATDFINVNIELEKFAKKATLTIFNIQGQIMETRNLSNIKNETVLFDLKNYANGTYTVLIETKEGRSVKRFVVVK